METYDTEQLEFTLQALHSLQPDDIQDGVFDVYYEDIERGDSSYEVDVTQLAEEVLKALCMLKHQLSVANTTINTYKLMEENRIERQHTNTDTIGRLISSSSE